MLYVKTPEETLALIEQEFSAVSGTELVSLGAAMGRVLAEDIAAGEYVPDFNRSTVDGYAVRAKDTFGCTDAIPAILPLQGEVLMGEGAEFALNPAECVAVPTGGAVPRGADSVVMIEYTEDYGDGTIGISKSVAPGQNMIFRGDDVFPGKVVLQKGRVLSSHDIGALAAIGRVRVPVAKKLKVGVISTGDELFPPEPAPWNISTVLVEKEDDVCRGHHPGQLRHRLRRLRQQARKPEGGADRPGQRPDGHALRRAGGPLLPVRLADGQLRPGSRQKNGAQAPQRRARSAIADRCGSRGPGAHAPQGRGGGALRPLHRNGEPLAAGHRRL